MIDKLLPLLNDPEATVKITTLKAMGAIGPAGITSPSQPLALSMSGEEEETGGLRAAAHVVSGADAKKEGSELMIAWLGQPSGLPRGICR